MGKYGCFPENQTGLLNMKWAMGRKGKGFLVFWGLLSKAEKYLKILEVELLAVCHKIM